MPKLYQEYKAERLEKRREIINNSISCFIAKTIEKITVNDICKVANISHGLFYHYFKDVNEIYLEINNDEKIIEIKNNLLLFNKSIGLLAHQKINKIIDYIEEYLSKRNNRDLILFVINDKSFKDDLSSLLEFGQRQGEITGGKPLDIASLIISFLIGYIFNATRGTKAFTPINRDLINNIYKKHFY